MSVDSIAGRLRLGDEFVVVSRRGKNTSVAGRSYLVKESKDSEQLNNEQIIGTARDGSQISLGKNTKVKKITSQGLLTD